MEITFSILAAFAIWRLFETGEIFVGAGIVGAAIVVLGIVYALLISSAATLTFFVLFFAAFGVLMTFLVRRGVAKQQKERQEWVSLGCSRRSGSPYKG